MSRAVLVCTRLVGGLALAMVLSGSARSQTTWHVDDDAPGDPGPGDPTIGDPFEDGSVDHPFDAIQEAIDAAADGDEVLVTDGTYTGGGNRDIEFRGKRVVVCSENGPEACVVDCEHGARGFVFDAGETPDAILDGLTITRGQATTGGGVYCRSSSPTIRACILRDNRADFFGGGMYCVVAGPRLIGCVFEDNNVSAGEALGGAVYNLESTVSLTDCTFTGNSAAGPDDGERGGAIASHGSTTTLIGCAITGNRADYTGGGIAGMADSVTTLIHCVVSHNSGST